MLLHIVQAFEKTVRCPSNRKKNSLFRFCNFYDACKNQKKSIYIHKMTEHLELHSFANIVAEIDAGALKI